MSVTKDCCKPAPPCQDNPFSGKEVTLAGLPAYVAGPDSASDAVILVSDVFGWQAPLLRKLADKIAAAGFLVVTPDFLKGDPFTIDGSKTMQDWLTNHTVAPAVPELSSLVAELKTKGVSSFGLTGFCWGGKVVAIAGKEAGAYKAIVQAHPSLVEASDYEEVKAALLVLASPTDGVEAMEPIIAARKDIESLVKIVPGVFHGWTCRYDDQDPEQVKNADQAHTDMIDWLTKYLSTTPAQQSNI